MIDRHLKIDILPFQNSCFHKVTLGLLITVISRANWKSSNIDRLT